MSGERPAKLCVNCTHWSEPAHKTVVYDPKEPWGRCCRGGADFATFPTPWRHTCTSWVLRRVSQGAQM